MVTVEELKESLLVAIGDYERCQTKHFLEVVIVAHINALIDAATKDGAERENLRIWLERDAFHGEQNERFALIPIQAFCRTTKKETFTPKK